MKILFDELNSSQVGSDLEYFDFHKRRFERFENFLKSQDFQRKNELKVLEIGSHYLHTSILLSNHGFSVDAMDVSEFWKLDFVQARANKYGLNPIIENDLASLESLKEIDDKYDLVVFTEILEHITFNPVSFWKQIHRVMKTNGIIYISTPNSFALPNLIRNLKNALLLKSIGISVDDILSKVTYGHHWKEYSKKEILEYFERLSPDFEVKISTYSYKEYELKPPFFFFKILSRIGNASGFFADDLEVIVNLRSKNKWVAQPPEY
ncbi:class I SAM-dependent methyltransferase [Algoriphagus sediminis]|uniref:Methyltransferase domain-containing protein n=1 Tax=Algoriphagus sediminis TaxID=3057113 RepID=A0ABT7YCE5_9BACT|nr:methyltransferase domain-containing protein [Algoriphagus sediminis]MDN3204148.1 methyltransferase domain-containing protein [Algoriphagus sediminis]